MAAVLALMACQRAGHESSPSTEEQKLLYMLGVSIAREQSGLQLTAEDVEYVLEGMREQVLREKRADGLELTDEVNQMFHRRLRALAAREQQKSRPFLEQAEKEPGVEKTASGLLFRSMVEGQGAIPTPEDGVKVHLRGLNRHGVEFHNTYAGGQPMLLKVGQNLPCFTEALVRMKVGGKARLVCPSELAFNEMGNGELVPPGAPVVFDLELLEIIRP
jgi:FKBP-type peptidyl-prolyl cis-trans isomerase FkpA